jgi:pyridoxamine 5'-phosphate oxidase family protein
MSAFTTAEIAYLTADQRPLGRVATVGPDGMPHVVPSGVTYNAEHDTLDISGIRLERTKKYRDIARTGLAAVVLDDVLPPWRPRGIEVRAHAEVLSSPDPLIRLRPRRIISWGLEGDDGIGDRHARDVP